MATLNFQEELDGIQEQKEKLSIAQDLLLNKALHGTDVDSIHKAQQFYSRFDPKKVDNFKFNNKGKALLIDPFYSSHMGYYDKFTSLSFDVLRNMAKSPIPRACIFTRKEQVADYSVPQQDKYSRGFVIRKKRSATEEEVIGELTSEEKKQIDYLTNFMLNCGEEDDEWFGDNFESFIRKLVEDSLTLDQACAEIIHSRDRKPYGFYMVDAAGMRIADAYGGKNQDSHLQGGKIDGYYPSHVQIHEGNIIAEWYPWEFMWGIRNPSTSIYSNGYGRSELEDLIVTVTAMLNSDQYNANFFKNGTAPKGALLVKKASGLNPDVIAEFKREWGGQMGGVNNMHKTPIFDAEHIEWMDLQKTNRDMEFSKYQEYLIKLVCAIYKISPEEIGFPIQGTQKGGGNRSGLGASKEKDYSMDKGLKPLLRSIQGWINKWVIGPLTEDKYEFIYVGIDAETSKDEEERLIKASAVYLKVDEIREMKGLKPLEEGRGDIILNPIMAQKEMMEAGMMGGGQMDGGEGKFDQEEGGYVPKDFGDDKNNPMMKSLLNDFDILLAEGK